jgi:hypothetical protein
MFTAHQVVTSNTRGTLKNTSCTPGATHKRSIITAPTVQDVNQVVHGLSMQLDKVVERRTDGPPWTMHTQWNRVGQNPACCTIYSKPCDTAKMSRRQTSSTRYVLLLGNIALSLPPAQKHMHPTIPTLCRVPVSTIKTTMNGVSLSSLIEVRVGRECSRTKGGNQSESHPVPVGHQLHAPTTRPHQARKK